MRRTHRKENTLPNLPKRVEPQEVMMMTILVEHPYSAVAPLLNLRKFRDQQQKTGFGTSRPQEPHGTKAARQLWAEFVDRIQQVV